MRPQLAKQLRQVEKRMYIYTKKKRNRKIHPEIYMESQGRVNQGSCILRSIPSQIKPFDKNFSGTYSKDV